jgi:hypothetical protein
MEISSLSAGSASQTVAAPAPQEGFKNQDRFNELIGKVNNSSGAYSETEQLEAWTALHDMAVTGGMIGMGDDNRKLYNQSANSAIAQKVKQIGQGYTMAMIAGAQTGGASGARQAALDFFDRQSAGNQDILFRGHINASDMSGARPFGDIEGWRASMLAGIRLDRFIETSSAGGAVNEKAATNAKLATALKLADAKRQDVTWMKQIADLLGERDPIEDKVSLSDQGKRAWNAASSSVAKVEPRPYEIGSLASRRV